MEEWKAGEEPNIHDLLDRLHDIYATSGRNKGAHEAFSGTNVEGVVRRNSRKLGKIKKQLNQVLLGVNYYLVTGASMMGLIVYFTCGHRLDLALIPIGIGSFLTPLFEKIFTSEYDA